jgi:hypothetical protein
MVVRAQRTVGLHAAAPLLLLLLRHLNGGSTRRLSASKPSLLLTSFALAALRVTDPTLTPPLLMEIWI